MIGDDIGRDNWGDLLDSGIGPASRGTGGIGSRATVPMTITNRLKEIICVVFGHEWNAYGRTESDDGRILEEYSECARCGLENHDRSGYLRL